MSTVTLAPIVNNDPTIGLNFDALAVLLNGGLDSTNLRNDPWISWTPTFTGATVGNGTITAWYFKLQRFVAFRILFTFGSTSATGGSGMAFTLPVTAATYNATSQSYNIGVGTAYDSLTNNFPLSIWMVSATTAIPTIHVADSTDVYAGNISATRPMVWTTSDALQLQGYYESAI